uniref:CLOCK-interacting pacemaker b n=1 Tax=Maylandia zebra TaxID=106582 RepID=A0A3P9BY58_9CICH
MSCHCYVKRAYLVLSQLSPLMAGNLPVIMKPGRSQADSERDSGFSDASSEHMSTMDTTDSEDSPHPVVQQGPRTTGSGTHPSGLAVVGGLSPMIIMNNVLLKQPGENPPALKPWGFSPTVEVVQQPQVVFIQPVVSRQASSGTKEANSKHRRPKKYFPILKSYPKIAPHPGDSSSSSGRGTAPSTYSSSSSSGAGNSGPTTPGLPATPTTMSPLLQSRSCLLTGETNTTPVRERPSSAVSQADCTTLLSFSHATGSKNFTLPVSPAVVSLSEGNDSDGDADTRRKRFCNTYNILSNSGLLDITLRTKELLKQNQRTQNDIDRLKKQTDLFLQALRSGDTSICVKLQATLLEEDRE